MSCPEHAPLYDRMKSDLDSGVGRRSVVRRDRATKPLCRVEDCTERAVGGSAFCAEHEHD